MMPRFYDPTDENLAKLHEPWCCSYSGGKDSTSLVTWIEWLRRTEQIKVEAPRLVMSDTSVEYPELVLISSDLMRLLSLNGWECTIVKPKINEKLYNRILGIGNTPIHPGGTKMRWCTRATKIDPMKRWRKANTIGLTLTGLRWGESKMRDGKLERRGCSAGGECGIPDPSEQTFSPIIDWKTCQVVDWLTGAIDPPTRRVMGDIHEITCRLVEIYDVKIGQDGFEFGEPEVTAARFGCIGCPAICSERTAPRSVVRRNGPDSPLNELYDVWFEARMRRNRLHRGGKDGYGPIKMEVRKYLLGRIIDIQKRAGVILVTPEDEDFIRACWENKVYPRGWSEADEGIEPPEMPLFRRK